MKKPWAMLAAAVLLAGLLTGCGAESPTLDAEIKQEDSVQETPSQEQKQGSQRQENLKAAEQKTENELVIDSGITVSGTVVTAAGKTFNLAEKNELVQAIAACRWLEKNKTAVLCEISGNNSQEYYFAVYDVVRDFYVYEQYGKRFIWQNDDLDTLVYVLDYAEEGEPSKVCNKKDMVLYESGAGEQITGVAFVPKGLKVELADLRGENPRQVIVEAAM